MIRLGGRGKGALLAVEAAHRRQVEVGSPKPLDVNVVELTFPVGSSFVAGDAVVRPFVHVYGPRIESTSYDETV